MSSWKRGNERHYCAICNAWMASDRQSILRHEQGAKHIKKAQEEQQKKRKEKSRIQNQESQVQKALAEMEQAALEKEYGVALPPLATSKPPVASPKTKAPPKLPPPKQEPKKRPPQTEKSESEPTSKKQKLIISPSEGVHTAQIGHTTYHYLQATTYHNLLEPDVPIELWKGPNLASWAEKQLPEKAGLWKSALVVHVRATTATISYLASPGATEETIEKQVSMDRIRIRLGVDHPAIPKTLEEARIVAMGGEDIEVAGKQAAVDEATGLSGWSTVRIQRTTTQLQDKEERERIRQARRQARQEKANLESQVQARKLEEAKVSNAEDSALGAYDVWNKGGGGYKGIQIEGTNAALVDTAKKLSQGKAVGFKKKKKLFGKKKQNRRTTSADDD